MSDPIIYWWTPEANVKPSDMMVGFTYLYDETKPTAEELYNNVLLCDSVVIDLTAPDLLFRPTDVAFLAGVAMAMGKTFYAASDYGALLPLKFAGCYQFPTLEKALEALKKDYSQESDTDSW